MRRARRPRMLGATTKAMPVSIVEEERRRRRGPDRTRALRGSAIGLTPRRRPQGWRACVSPLMRVHVSGPPADVAVFMATSTKARGIVMPRFKRFVLVVLDGCGVGEMPDAADWGDAGSDTLGHVLAACKPELPNLQRLGLGNIRP